jgi:hypothetical protein
MSLEETFALFPIETNWVNPSFRAWATFKIATPSAPDARRTRADRRRRGRRKVASMRVFRLSIDDAHAVGADHAHSLSPDELRQTPLEVGSFGADLLESRGDDDEPLHPLRAQSATTERAPRTETIAQSTASGTAPTDGST